MSETPHKPLSPSWYRWSAVGFVVCALALSGILAFLVWAAVNAERNYSLYAEQAVVTTAVITGFDTFTTQGHRGGDRLHTLPVVEFVDKGRRVRTRLMLAHPVFPHQREASIGRSIEVRYPPGQPGAVIPSDAMDLLSRAINKWTVGLGLALSFFISVTLYGAVFSLREARKLSAAG